jgi:hypothetical protein
MDIVVKGEMALFGSQDYARSGELFRDRTHVEDRRRREGNGKFEAGCAVAFAINKLAVPYDAKRTSRGHWLIVGSKNPIHFLPIGLCRNCAGGD